MGTLPTVRILDPKGSGEPRTINLSDFRPGTHTLWPEGTAVVTNTTADHSVIVEAVTVEVVPTPALAPKRRRR